MLSQTDLIVNTGITICETSHFCSLGACFFICEIGIWHLPRRTVELSEADHASYLHMVDDQRRCRELAAPVITVAVIYSKISA